MDGAWLDGWLDTWDKRGDQWFGFVRYLTASSRELPRVVRADEHPAPLGTRSSPAAEVVYGVRDVREELGETRLVVGRHRFSRPLALRVLWHEPRLVVSIRRARART